MLSDYNAQPALSKTLYFQISPIVLIHQRSTRLLLRELLRVTPSIMSSSNRLSTVEPPPSYESIRIDRRISNPSSTRHLNPSRTQTAPTPKAPSLLPLLTIPTKKYPLSSGFPYDSSIFRLGVSPDVWAQFSDEIVQATKLSLAQQSLAWTSGIGVGLVSVAAVPPFGAAAGVFAGKAVYDKSILNKVKQGLGGGKLGEVLNRWNEKCWREKGVLVHLTVKQGKQHTTRNDSNQSKDASRKKDKKKDQRQAYGRFELVFESASAVPSRIDTTVMGTNARAPVEIAETHTNTVPFELDDVTVAAVASTRPQLFHPMPRLANEKAIAAAAARSSWTSAHPSEPPHWPVSDTEEDNTTPEATDRDLSPVSDVSQRSCVSPNRTSQDEEVSAVSEGAERRPYDHLNNFTNASLAPAPLFATLPLDRRAGGSPSTEITTSTSFSH